MVEFSKFFTSPRIYLYGVGINNYIFILKSSKWFFSWKLCGLFVSHGALYSFYTSGLVSGTGLIIQALLFEDMFWCLHDAFIPFMPVNEYEEPDCNWNSSLRFPILCHYLLHHTHTHAYNTDTLKSKYWADPSLLNFSYCASSSVSKWYGHTPRGKWQGWLASNEVCQPINQSIQNISYSALPEGSVFSHYG